jgi:peptidoglycan/xylan/chitin deacetylase (PgdA/CDA1 family)
VLKLRPDVERSEICSQDGAVSGEHGREMTERSESTAPAVLRRIEGVRGRIALTFDDCDDPAAWERILDVLDDRSVPATFFPLG